MKIHYLLLVDFKNWNLSIWELEFLQPTHPPRRTEPNWLIASDRPHDPSSPKYASLYIVSHAVRFRTHLSYFHSQNNPPSESEYALYMYIRNIVQPMQSHQKPKTIIIQPIVAHRNTENETHKKIVIN